MSRGLCATADLLVDLDFRFYILDFCFVPSSSCQNAKWYRLSPCHFMGRPYSGRWISRKWLRQGHDGVLCGVLCGMQCTSNTCNFTYDTTHCSNRNTLFKRFNFCCTSINCGMTRIAMVTASAAAVKNNCLHWGLITQIICEISFKLKNVLSSYAKISYGLFI